MATYTLPPLLTSRLDAVNSLLQSIGEAPVSSVEVSEAVDVAAASLALKEVTNATQTEGWHWNREYDFVLEPQTDGTIPLPHNCLSVMAAYYTASGVGNILVTERARKLYNPVSHSFVFNTPAHVDMILLLEWEEMPEDARRYITIRAAQLFQGRIQTNRIVQAVQQPEVDMARSVLEQREDEAVQYNQISGNAQVAYRLNGRMLRRRY